MIALLAAVPFETEQLRSRLNRQSDDCWTGQIAGDDVLLTHSGVGKANAAAAACRLILRHAPQAVILLGCGGAYPGSALRIGDLAVASVEIFGDEGSLTPDGFLDLEQLQLPIHRSDRQTLYNHVPLDPLLSKWAGSQLTEFTAPQGRNVKRGAFATVSCCSGTTAGGTELAARTGGICENMEGAAVALVCYKHGLPLLELRGISNRVEDRDPRRWDLPAATMIAQAAVLHLLQHWPEKPCR
ncbi:MAG TPA: futalosine hydrolase [Geothermobacteraceae bacterium]|nr:futalosine hydrolase [Geothermobacteraceae bacterium]